MCLKGSSQRCYRKNIFGSTKNHSVKGSLKNISFLSFYNLKNLIHHKKTFLKQKGSSDVKGSLWNYLDKQVLLWHREAPLLLGQ